MAADEPTADEAAASEDDNQETRIAEESGVTDGSATEGVQTDTGPSEAEGAAAAEAENSPEDASSERDSESIERLEREGGLGNEDAIGQGGVETLDDGRGEGNEAAETDSDESPGTGGDRPDTGDRLAAAIASAEAAAADLQVAAARLPAIVERIDAIVARVEELPIEELVTELTSLASSANTLVSSEETRALPGNLSATLAALEAILREFREGGLIENANATLQSTRAATDILPGLAERAGVLLGQAGVTLEGFEDSGRVVREAEQALREVARAAEAVGSLARAIERDPNSLLFGRR